jgi:hypothetical protein
MVAQLFGITQIRARSSPHEVQPAESYDGHCAGGHYFRDRCGFRLQRSHRWNRTAYKPLKLFASSSDLHEA